MKWKLVNVQNSICSTPNLMESGKRKRDRGRNLSVTISLHYHATGTIRTPMENLRKTRLYTCHRGAAYRANEGSSSQGHQALTQEHQPPHYCRCLTCLSLCFSLLFQCPESPKAALKYKQSINTADMCPSLYKVHFFKKVLFNKNQVQTS